MPTARQHFEKFPEPYRSQAIENTSEEDLNKEYQAAEDALFISFSWCDAPQEPNYWYNFYLTLC